MLEELLYKMYLSDFEYLHPFQRYSLSKFKVDRNRAKLCMFLAPKKFMGEAPPKFWTRIIKLSTLPITV